MDLRIISFATGYGLPLFALVLAVWAALAPVTAWGQEPPVPKATLVIEIRTFTDAAKTALQAKPANLGVFYVGAAGAAHCEAVATDGTPENLTANEKWAAAIPTLIEAPIASFGGDFNFECSSSTKSSPQDTVPEQ